MRRRECLVWKETLCFKPLSHSLIKWHWQTVSWFESPTLQPNTMAAVQCCCYCCFSRRLSKLTPYQTMPFFFLFFLPVTDIYIIREFGKFWVTESFQKRKNKVLVISFRKICIGKKTTQQAICSYLKVDQVGQRPRSPYLTLSKKLSNSLNLSAGCRSVLLLGQHWSCGARRSKAPRTPHPSDTQLWPRGWCGRKI